VRGETLSLTERLLWEVGLERRTATDGLRQWIDLGTLRLPREKILGCRIEDIVESDRAGRIATLGLFIAAALVLLIGIVDLDWRTKALLAGSVLAIVGLAAGMDSLGVGRTVQYRLDILLADGRRIGYTTMSRRDAEDLADELGPIPVMSLD
jgi:hypothetical protein